MLEARKPTAGQRIIKARNARLVLEALKKLSINVEHASANRGEALEHCQVTAESIICGHAREVLALLWAIAFESFDRVVPISQLRVEIALLERKLRLKGLSPSPKHPPLLPGNASPITEMLFCWARAVCGLYGVTIRSCTTSFTDGSALCLLVHHYVPRLIDWTAIAIPAPVPRDVAEDILGGDGLGAMESLSWSDNLGLQNSSVQQELESYRRVF
jgi:abnormal spindle-like microcephaly-associated protein